MGQGNERLLKYLPSIDQDGRRQIFTVLSAQDTPIFSFPDNNLS